MFQFKVCQFKNNLIESYFSDGSKFIWKNQTITYFSEKGIRTKINLQDLKNYIKGYKSSNIHQDLTIKFSNVIKVCNSFNDEIWMNQFQELTKKYQQKAQNNSLSIGNSQQKSQQIFKKIKINEFVWDTTLNRVKKNEAGDFQIMSQDRNAKAILDKNLFLINVQYLQLFPGKKVQKSNHAKHLLEKYNYSYTQFPTNSLKSQFSYQYRKVHKTFCIFNLPQRWYIPIHQIWKHILSNKLANQKFCYIDFSDRSDDIYDIYKCTMPPCLKLQNRNKNKNNIQLKNIRIQDSLVPIFGKANNHEKCQWVYISKSQTQTKDMMFWFGQMDIFLDGIGYWFAQGNSISYKKFNKQTNDKKYHSYSVPPIIKIQNQPQRNLKGYLDSFISYINHNNFVLSSIENEQNLNNNINDDISKVSEVSVEGIGTLKAYSNKMVVGNFTDKSIISIRSNNLKIITPFGDTIESCLQNQNRSQLRQYNEHLSHLIDYHDRIFYEKQWKEKKLLQVDIQFQLQATQLFLKSCQKY